MTVQSDIVPEPALVYKGPPGVVPVFLLQNMYDAAASCPLVAVRQDDIDTLGTLRRNYNYSNATLMDNLSPLHDFTRLGGNFCHSIPIRSDHSFKERDKSLEKRLARKLGTFGDDVRLDPQCEAQLVQMGSYARLVSVDIYLVRSFLVNRIHDGYNVPQATAFHIFPHGRDVSVKGLLNVKNRGNTTLETYHPLTGELIEELSAQSFEEYLNYTLTPVLTGFDIPNMLFHPSRAPLELPFVDKKSLHSIEASILMNKVKHPFPERS